MRVKKITRDDVKYLTPADRTAICMIYTHRCLTRDQLFRYYYSEESSRSSYADRHVQKMLDEGYIQAVFYGEDGIAYFIATRGVYLVRRLVAIKSTKLYGVDRDSVDLHWRAHELMLDPSKIRHQIALNEFVLDFDKRAEPFNLENIYYDEKFVPDKGISSRRARPDGIIELPNVTLYLEMDMNTERSARLNSKWKAYRVLFNTYSFWESREKKPVVVLFILENTVQPLLRRSTVTKTVYTHLMDCISDRLDLHIGVPLDIMNLIFDKFMSEKEDPLIEKIKNDLAFRGLSFAPVSRKTDLPTYDLYAQDEHRSYFIDSYKDASMFTLKKIIMVGTNLMLMRTQLDKNSCYIVVFDDEATLFKDLSIIKPFDFDNVLFADASGDFIRYFKYDAFFSQHNISTQIQL